MAATPMAKRKDFMMVLVVLQNIISTKAQAKL
jgi:hypothetical protein